VQLRLLIYSLQGIHVSCDNCDHVFFISNPAAAGASPDVKT
jgi:hypothetical protein